MSLAWLPNAITLARIALVPPLGWLLAQGHYRAALVLAVVAGLSDALDGLLARRFGWRSDLGGLLDPMADKLLLAAGVIGLAWNGHLPPWFVLLVIGRDLVILGGALAWRIRVGPLLAAPTALGKITTFLQIVLVVAVLLQLGVGGLPGDWLDALLWLTAAATLASGIDYVLRWSRKARRAHASPSEITE